jgi:hypothetical protein
MTFRSNLKIFKYAVLRILLALTCSAVAQAKMDSKGLVLSATNKLNGVQNVGTASVSRKDKFKGKSVGDPNMWLHQSQDGLEAAIVTPQSSEQALQKRHFSGALGVPTQPASQDIDLGSEARGKSSTESVGGR